MNPEFKLPGMVDESEVNFEDTGEERKNRGILKAIHAMAIAISPSFESQEDSLSLDEVFELSPFSIHAEETEGYSATSTLAGTRLKTNLRDLGAAISVMTPELFEDTGATDAESLLAYGLNTEISGVNGNFANPNISNGVSDTTGARREPHKANRIRGLAVATLTRGQFLTDIPFDGYNTSMVTINRGPNSLLFGIGSPGGVIDSGLKAASLGRDFGEFSLRFGERGSHRETVDYNKVLLEDRLAIRVAALNEEIQFEQTRLSKMIKRFYAAFDSVLAKNENSSFLGRTSLRGNIEYGKIEGTPVSIIPPADALKGWFQNDHYSRSLEQYTGVTLPGWVDDGSFVPRRTIDNFEVAKQFGGQVPGGARFSLGGGMSFQTFGRAGCGYAQSRVGRQLWQRGWRPWSLAIARTATADNPVVEHWSNWPLELHGSQLPGFNVPVMDQRVLDITEESS